MTMPAFGLSDKTLAAIRQILADYPAVKKAILYGSRAKGNYKKGSDIDLTLIGDALDHRILGKIAGRLEESPIPYQVDLSLWKQIDNQNLLEHIERVGVVFYERADRGEDIKKGWKTRTLGDICGFVRGPFGGSLKKSVFVENGFAVYEQQHAIYNQFEDVRYFIDSTKFKEMQRFELRPNDLIMSCSGTMGKVAIVPDNIRAGIINQALLKLTPSSAVSSEFLKYWMDSTDFQNSLNEQSGVRLFRM
ncbi:MAG: nucleotidyltransferase domain-containing protein [Candidatus Competibacteraceae bacterium]|nr:nucleotidyltransferase domain-containing protein [Candidatus Competibacteraceae bacterium]